MIAASFDLVADHIEKCIYSEYDEAINELPFDKEEWAYFGKTWDTQELLTEEIELELPRDKNDQLLWSLIENLGEKDWCENVGLGLNDREVASFSWEYFCKIIMHERRFFFLGRKRPSDDPQVLSPSETLKTILDYAKKIDLISEMQPNMRFYRAREQNGEKPLKTAVDLGPPPKNLATQANRMSPPGIVMFYASDSKKTAVREIASKPGKFVVGEFKAHRKSIILDLTRLPPIPSLFSNNAYLRKLLFFLHHVKREISRPIKLDNRLHLEYVPTQVVTEYIRFQYQKRKAHIDGIKYPSSIHPGHNSLVLFATQENILSVPQNPGQEFRFKEDRWLELIGRSIVNIRESDLKK